MRSLLFPFVVIVALQSFLAAQDVPAALKPYLKKDIVVKAEAVAVVPPEEVDKYLAKVQEGAKKDPEWFKEYSKAAPGGVPLPFHEKLGLTKEEYDAYIKAWDARKFKTVENVQLRLDEDDGEWIIRATGKKGLQISLLRYQPKEDAFYSPNGALKRIEDIDADEKSILGGWTGKEWKFSEESEFISMKENVAIGKTKDGKYGMLVYRIQEISPTGRLLYDKSAVIRFSLTK